MSNAEDDFLKSFRNSVKTHKGTVQLSGFVNSQKAVDKAGEIVRSIKGLKSIKNSLIVKQAKEENMGTILIVILILVLVGALPTWPHSKSWGYYPSGGLGLVLLIVLILLLMGRI